MTENKIFSPTEIKQKKKLFNEKCKFLLDNHKYEFMEAYLPDYFSYVFDRDGVFDFDFEDTNCKEYQQWKLEYEKLGKRQKQWKEQHPDVADEEFNGRINYNGFAQFRYNPITIEFSKLESGKPHREHSIILRDRIDLIERLEGRDFVITSPITYVGRSRYSGNARYLYGIVIDLDGVGMKELESVINQMHEERNIPMNSDTPIANMIVNSGNGIHLYYLLKNPIPLYKQNCELLNKLKHGLTNMIWNNYTSTYGEKNRQYQGIFQGFRLPGTSTKFGAMIRAFYNNDSNLFTIEQLNKYASSGYALTKDELNILKGFSSPKTITLNEAQRRWPEWYEKVVVQGDKRPKKWHIKEALYEWWLNKIQGNGVISGHRYFCLMILSAYAIKCDINKERLKKDALSLVQKFDQLTTDEDNHFTEQDALDAITAYKIEYSTLPKNSIQYLSGIKMPEANRRNGEDQRFHLKIARLKRDLKREKENKGVWDLNNGRKKETWLNSKNAVEIAVWRLNNPDVFNKSKCAKEIGLTRPTVRKWWNGFDLIKEKFPINDIPKENERKYIKESLKIISKNTIK